MRNLLTWYVGNLTRSYAWPVFATILYMQHLLGMNLAWSDIIITPQFPYQMGGVGILFVVYVVITLFTGPMESAQYLFEHTLPFTRTDIFVAKYLGGYIHLFLTFATFYGIFFPLSCGYFDPYQFSVLLASLALSLLYLYSVAVFFGLLTRRNVGAIMGGILLIAVSTVVLSLNLNFPPNPPVWSGYLYADAFGVACLICAYLIYRRVDL